ncbi:MAG: hypothetical protein LBH26_00390, partial [Treponema sp.]|nr:hypothetical protein [Treponema sp.]
SVIRARTVFAAEESVFDIPLPRPAALRGIRRGRQIKYPGVLPSLRCPGNAILTVSKITPVFNPRLSIYLVIFHIFKQSLPFVK